MSVYGHFEFCNIHLTQEMQNDWTMNMKQKFNVSHKDNPWMTNFKLKDAKWLPACHFFLLLFFFLIISEILHDS